MDDGEYDDDPLETGEEMQPDNQIIDEDELWQQQDVQEVQ
jgi:hypothetical protein